MCGGGIEEFRVVNCFTRNSQLAQPESSSPAMGMMMPYCLGEGGGMKRRGRQGPSLPGLLLCSSYWPQVMAMLILLAARGLFREVCPRAAGLLHLPHTPTPLHTCTSSPFLHLTRAHSALSLPSCLLSRTILSSFPFSCWPSGGESGTPGGWVAKGSW